MVGEPGRRQAPGPVIALAVVGVVLVLGGLFLWLGPLPPDENTSVWVSSAQGAVARVDAGSSRLLDVIPITDGDSGVLIEGLASSDRYLSIAAGVAGPARLRRRDPGATRARTPAAHRRLDGQLWAIGSGGSMWPVDGVRAGLGPGPRCARKICAVWETTRSRQEMLDNIGGGR